MTISLKRKAVEAVEGVENVHPVQKVKTLGRFVPNKLSRPAYRAGLKVSAKSPELLFVGGLVLGGATVVSACRATLKLEGVLQDIQSDLDDVRELESRDMIPDGTTAAKFNRHIKVTGALKIGKLYAPSAGLAVLAVASLTGSHHIMTKRNVAIAAAYSTLEKSFDEYRDRVKEKYGEENEREILHGRTDRTIVEDTDKGPKKVHVKSYGRSVSPYARVWDEVSSKNWKNNAYTNRTFIMCQQNWANDMLQAHGHLFLNDVYKMLGLSETAAGQRVGWFVGNGDSYVDFGIYDRMKSDETVHEFMFGEEKSILLDFNVDGDVYTLLDELNNNDKN